MGSTSWESDYWALRHEVGAAWVARDMVRVVGPEAVSYLQGQLSQDIETLTAGGSAESLLLSPQGKIDALVRVIRTADAIVASTEAERQSLVEQYGARGERIAVMPPGVDLELFRPVDRALARASLGLILSRRSARQLKMTLGLTGGDTGWAEAVGIDSARRTPRVEKVSGEVVATALEPIVNAIARTVQEILSDIPAGLAEDVVRGKVRLSGGGALLPGLADRIESISEIGVAVVDDPLRCVVRGAAALLEQRGVDGAPGLA